MPRTHWPRDIKHLEERLATIQRRLGERRRMFRNLHRLNCVLMLMLLELRGEASVSAWARILRDNHRAHEGKPPPRRPARRRAAHSVAKACDLTGGSREIYLAPAVSQPRFSHTSSVADARFIV